MTTVTPEVKIEVSDVSVGEGVSGNDIPGRKVCRRWNTRIEIRMSSFCVCIEFFRITMDVSTSNLRCMHSYCTANLQCIHNYFNLR
ncbi:hypothetical protein Hdeb2414_s0016g00490141 [Helianthus debilis subsp. tardiflorus]